MLEEALTNAIQRVIESEQLSFESYAKTAGLDPQIDFINADLSGIELTSIVFGEVNFEHATFEGARLQNSSFVGSNLRNAIFRNANCRCVNFEGVPLYRADFSNARLEGASFRGAGLQNVTIDDASLEGVDLSETSKEMKFANQHVAMRLKERQNLLGVTQKQLAGLIGIDRAQITKYENGMNLVSAGRLYMIAGALGVDVSSFFEGLFAEGHEAEKREGTSRKDLLRQLVHDFVAIKHRELQEALCSLTRVLARFDPELNEQHA